MQRHVVKKRDDWKRKFDELGFTFHSMGGVYWNEGACYEFSSGEIDHLEEVTNELHALCLQAVEDVIDRNLFHKMGIPDQWAAFATDSWKRSDRSLYGRFDFSYDGESEPKLLEYNADTPTSLLESSIAQWIWLEDVYQNYDQFNSIHEKLQDAFHDLKNSLPWQKPFYFTCIKDHEEDWVTVEYLRDVAVQCGLDGRHIFIEDIGFDAKLRQFCDLDNHPVHYVFKLYPWEWLLADEFGAQVLQGSVHFFEPAWKMILSNKGILPVLWALAPGHPNLLPAFFGAGHIKGDRVRKPLFSREGANISMRAGGKTFEGTDACYGAEGYIYQQTHPLPNFSGHYAVTGSWVVNGRAAGVGIREDSTPITSNTSRFAPHFFRP